MIILKSKKFISIILIFFSIILGFVIYFEYYNNFNISNNNNNNNNNSNSDSNINNNDNNSSYYNELYGTWAIDKHISSNINTTLNDTMISFCIGKKFKIEKDNIYSIYGSFKNPNISEKIMTEKEFYNTYRDTFDNIGIPGDKVKWINIASNDNPKYSVVIFISDNEDVYALVKGTIFKLKKVD